MNDTVAKILYWADPPHLREQVISRVSAVPGVELTVTTTFDETIEHVRDYDGVILGDRPLAEAVTFIEAIEHKDSKMRHLHFLSAGREGFLAAGLPERLTVTGPEGANAPAVAEHAMALLLALIRQIPAVVRNTDSGIWDRPAIMPRVRSLEGMTVAILGLGNIGREIAGRVHAFGATTIGVVRAQRNDPAVHEVATFDSLHSVLARADVIMVAAALTPENHGLVGRAELAAAKPGALVVNIARGPLLDQEALVDALESGQIGGAGLDVTDPEPLPATDRLWRSPNVIISPHFGGSSPHSLLRNATMAATMAESLVARL